MMPTHWPDLARLTTDCLCCAINACEDSHHAEDQAFAKACQEEMGNRLRGARKDLDVAINSWREPVMVEPSPDDEPIMEEV